MKNVLWILFLMASVFSSCKKEEPGAQPEGQKEIVQLSFSGQLPEARDLVLTPKEVGGKLKVETKVTGRTLRVKMLISGANGYNQNLEGDVKMAEDGKSFRFDEEVDISRMTRPIKLSVFYFHQNNGIVAQKVYKLDKTRPILLPVAFTSFGNTLVEEVDPHGKRSLVGRNISLSLAGFIMRVKFKNETGKDYVIKSIRSQSLTPTGAFYDGSSNKQSLLVNQQTIQQKFDGSESGLVLRDGDTSDEYLMYCAASPSQYIQGAMSLDVEPTDGVYDQAVYTDFGRALTPAGVVGKIVTRTVKLRELKSPLTYFDSKMVGQTPTAAVTPMVTFTGFQDKASVNVNVGYYDRTEIDQINVSGYHIPSEYEWQGFLPGLVPWSVGTRSVFFPSRLRADRILYNREGYVHLSVPDGDHQVNKDYYAPATSYALPGGTFGAAPRVRAIQVGDRVFEYGDASFVRDGVESIPLKPWLQDSRPGIQNLSEIIPLSLPILEDPNKKLVIYALTLGGETLMSSGTTAIATQVAPNSPEYKVVKLLNGSARFAYKYTFYRDRAVIETCPVGGNPNIKTAADVRDRNLFATSSKVVRREILYVPGDGGWANVGGIQSITKRNGDFIYSRDGAGTTILYPPASSGAPVQHTYAAPEYPLIYLYCGVMRRSEGITSPANKYVVESNLIAPIGLRDKQGGWHKGMPQVMVRQYAAGNAKYPVWLIKNAN